MERTDVSPFTDRDFAIANSLIYEGVSPSSLPRQRTYTFIILDDGTAVFGEVNTALEFGTKHFQLANGRPVKAAGELHIAENGVYHYTSDGTTFWQIAYMIQKNPLFLHPF